MVEVDESPMKKLYLPTWGFSFILSFSMNWIGKFWVSLLYIQSPIEINICIIPYKEVFTGWHFHSVSLFFFSFFESEENYKVIYLNPNMYYLLKKIMSCGEDNPSSHPLRKSSCDLQYACCHTSYACGLYVPSAFSIMASWCAVSAEARSLLHLPLTPDLMALRLRRFCMSFSSSVYM